MNYFLLVKITQGVPDDLDRKQEKEIILKQMRDQITERDGKNCQLCGLHSEYGNPRWGLDGKSHIHHIVPNGPATPENLITLCEHCHHAVHLLLFSSGKWKFPFFMKGFR